MWSRKESQKIYGFWSNISRSVIAAFHKKPSVRQRYQSGLSFPVLSLKVLLSFLSLVSLMPLLSLISLLSCLFVTLRAPPPHLYA